MAFKVECAHKIRNGLCVRFGQGKLIKQIDERKKRVAPLIRQRGMRRKAAHVDFRGSFIQSLGGTAVFALFHIGFHDGQDARERQRHGRRGLARNNV